MLQETKTDLRKLLTIALPMIISQGTETVMMFVDRLFLSRVGILEISAAMSGGLSSFVFNSFFIGLVGYVNAMVAQYYGAGKKTMCTRSSIQAIYLSFFSYPMILSMIPVGILFFKFMGLGPEQVAMATSYMRILLFGSIMFILRTAMGSFFIGLGKTRIVMYANIAAMVMNIPANYVLIFGKMGFPAMGLEGAAYGTLFGGLFTFGILLVMYLKTIREVEFMPEKLWKLEWSIVRRLLRFGLPAGVEGFLNIAAFNIFVHLMHSYGPEVAAAVTITFNWDIVAFIPMLGLSIAITAVTGQYIGAKKLDKANSTAYLGLKVGYCYSGTMMMLFIFGAGTLVRVFSSGFGPDGGETFLLARTLLRLASLYTLADVTQLIFSGALRAAGDTRWIMRTSILIHWSMASISFVVVKLFRPNPVYVWCIFISLILLMSVLMFNRFRSGKWKEIKLID